jgi:hypothetical protein
MRTLTNDFLAASDIRDSMRKYEAIYYLAERQTRLFLSQNAWLQTFLKEQYEDLHKGLFFFFAEHSFTTEEVRTTSSRFSDIRGVIRSVSNAIISDRGGKSRISPKRGVKDSQIREIVAAAFFSELFYEVPADLITLISAYETNFSMEYWEGGFGTTQQTTRAANTVLQSDYWIDKASESAGVKIRMQLVPISALDNVFLCITEGAKTVAIKAAELEIRTRDIITMKKVKFGGKKVPALWATAFKYNGSKRYARSYAKNIQRYYQKRESWLKSFDSGPYLLFAMK